MTFDRKPKIEELVEDYEPKSVEVIISGRKVTVYEMSLTALESAVRVVEPHIASLLQAFQAEGFADIAKGKIDTEALTEKIIDTLRSKALAILADAPTAILRAIGCMMNAEPDDDQMLDVLKTATPRELMELLEKLNELNDFRQVLTKLTEILGYLRQRYTPESN